MTNSLHITAIPGLPIIQPGDDLAALIAGALTAANLTLQADDVLVVTSKIVSKAEGRRVDLRTITPGDEAQRLAEITRKDPRVVELVLRESTEVSRARPGVLIVRHRLGFVSANAGIDQSNVAGDDETVLLLPSAPDASAAALRERLSTLTGAHVGIVISDSHGRAWRVGNLGVAIGVSGLPAVRDLRGQSDLFGRTLQISIQGYADMIASAAGLLSGEANEGLPVVLVRGLTAQGDGQATDINRAIEFDLYR
ncbi:MAG: coenzyme F420-0:L-glutamate ligase [Anaerolineae bacterium]|nr:coenzyme F420-0:L-glutamate ligase [Anaerolineae bacterium]